MQLRYDADEDERPLRTPILVSLFRAVGVVILLATALFALTALHTQQAIANIPVAAVIGAAGVLVSLVPFGIAQVILLVAKIEYNTATQKDAAILHSLHKIEGHLKGVAAAGEVKSKT